ncbi:MAG TPA: MFS transporter [Geminicoccaceae bacterium]|nr:MFS transporter [Geminicoccaceae bacterium]
MATVLRSSLMVGVAILLLGNGLIGTLLGVRAGIEAFPTVAVGIIMSCYYVGYIGGAHLGPAFISRVGHIRTFAALAAIAATTAGLHAMFVHPVTWGVLRLITGLCFAGLYVVLESWINGRSTNSTRGLLLSVYMFVSYAGLALGQQLLNLYDPAGFELFILSSTLISLSLVPFALTRRAAPEVPAMAGLDLRRVYEISPLGIIGCFAVGVGNGAFWGLGPLFAQGIGLPVAGISIFMSAVIVGGMLMQVPLGRLSDRLDRRKLIITACLANTLLGIAISAFGARSELLLFALAFAYGGFALTLYSLCVAHTNDFMKEADLVAASGALLLAFGVGALLGPVLGSLFMTALGPQGLFVHIAFASAALAGFGIYRMRRRATVPKEEQDSFVAVPETTTVVHQLDPRVPREEGATAGAA